MVMLAAQAAAKSGVAKKVARKVSQKLGGKSKKAAVTKAGTPRRRRSRLLTLSQREELMWISRHLGRTAAAERMAHYRR